MMDNYEQASALLTLLESKVRDLKASRAERVRRVVDVTSFDQLYWYVTDANGKIAIKQDSAFRVTGVHVINANNEFLVQVQNLWPLRNASFMGALPASMTSVSNVNMVTLQFVPVDHYMPAFNTDTDNLFTVNQNVDYWYEPITEWIIARGDTIQFTYTTTTDPPVVVLSGSRIIG